MLYEVITREAFRKTPPEAYETLLLDVMRGDATLFMRADQVDRITSYNVCYTKLLRTSLNRNSRVWFTLSHGILNEVYYPRIDKAAIRDSGLVVTDGQAFFSEEKRDTQSRRNNFV